jgi:Mg2+ and Co2+ transporter CorA
LYPLHRLAVEDLIVTHSRTKVDWFKDQAFVVLTLQKLVRLHYGGDGHDCQAKGDEESQTSGKSWSWWPRSRSSKKNLLPKYLDQNHDGVIDEYIKAHSTTSESSPIKDIRTLHRYESAQIPEHTAFMERHSALMVSSNRSRQVL